VRSVWDTDSERVAAPIELAKIAGTGTVVTCELLVAIGRLRPTPHIVVPFQFFAANCGSEFASHGRCPFELTQIRRSRRRKRDRLPNGFRPAGLMRSRLGVAAGAELKLLPSKR